MRPSVGRAKKAPAGGPDQGVRRVSNPARAATSATTRVSGSAGSARQRAVKKRPVSGSTGAEMYLKDATAGNLPALLCQKLRLCMKCYDFSDSMVDMAGKERKQQTLMEICDFLSAPSKPSPLANESVVATLIEMVSLNLFRAPVSATAEPSEDDEVALDPSYVHSQLVYEILLRFVTSSEVDSALMRKYINYDFILKVLAAFDTEDPRAREYLKTILHRIYGRFMTYRLAIRKAFNNTFFRFVYEEAKHAGIGEILEILGSIINGFALPLKEEHKFFLQKFLMPLHKPSTMMAYHPQLCYCVVQFCEKDEVLIEGIILNLIQWWPHQNSNKEVNFLNELEEILEIIGEREFENVLVPLFRRIGKCISGHHFQVSERALILWQSPPFLDLVRDHRMKIMPLVYPSLVAAQEKHWNSSVSELAGQVLQMYVEMDRDLIDKCAAQHLAQQANQKEVQSVRDRNWSKIETLAAQNRAKK